MTEQNGLAAALAELQTKLPRIEKSEVARVETKQGGSYSYTYADLANLSDQILPLLGGLGMSFTCRPTFSGDRFVLAYRLWHVSGEHIEGEYPLPTSGTPQAVGSAITYGRRYCLCAITGIAPEDDDDGATAEAQATANRGTAKRAIAPKKQARPSEPAEPKAQRTHKRADPPPLPADEAQVRQNRRLHAAYNKAGITDRQDKLDYAISVIDRPITSSTDLTDQERSRVIEQLEAIADPFPDEPPMDPAEASEEAT